MEINDDMTVADLKKLLGRRGSFSTIRGKSATHIIEGIEFIDDGVNFVLREATRFGQKRRRRPEYFIINGRE